MAKKKDDSVSEKSSQSTLKRRTFIGVTSAIGAMAASGTGPAIAQSRSSRPVVISSGNGFVYRNGGSETCVERAYRMMTEGTDVLESLVAGVQTFRPSQRPSAVERRRRGEATKRYHSFAGI